MASQHCKSTNPLKLFTATEVMADTIPDKALVIRTYGAYDSDKSAAARSLAELDKKFQERFKFHLTYLLESRGDEESCHKVADTWATEDLEAMGY